MDVARFEKPTVICRIGSLENVNITGDGKIYGYLPYRQLRNGTARATAHGKGYLPYRQLRNYPLARVLCIDGYLPYRQLRKIPYTATDADLLLSAV